MESLSKGIGRSCSKVVKNTFKMILHGTSCILKFFNTFMLGYSPKPIIPEDSCLFLSYLCIIYLIEFLKEFIGDAYLIELRVSTQCLPSLDLILTPILSSLEELVPKSRNKVESCFIVLKLSRNIFLSVNLTPFFFF